MRFDQVDSPKANLGPPVLGAAWAQIQALPQAVGPWACHPQR